MAPSRKSRSVNRKDQPVNDEASSGKQLDTPRKSQPRKRKLSDMLGPQWSKDELERFYKAYRKSGQDWEKVAAAVRTRSAEMAEALYTMNRAYLSLPKGYASAAGLIAMMTDHYSNMGDSDSDEDNNESPGASRKSQKRARGAKGAEGPPVPDVSSSQPASSDEGCLSMLMRRRYVSKPWAVGKRTPRVPVSFSSNKGYGENHFSLVRRGTKLKSNALDDDVAHEIALALAEASQRGGSPQFSRTPNKKSNSGSPVKNAERMQAESEMKSTKVYGDEFDEGGCELSLGSTDVGDYASLKETKHSRKLEMHETMDDHLDDSKEACSGTEEGQKMDCGKGKFEMEDMDSKLGRTPNKGLRKRSKKIPIGEDEDAALDALQALADLSLRLPEAPADTESSVDPKDERISTMAKSKSKGNQLSPGVKITSSKTTRKGKALPLDVITFPEAKEATNHVNFGLRKRRQKSLAAKPITAAEEHSDTRLEDSKKVEDSCDADDFVTDENRSRDGTHKPGKLLKPPAILSSSVGDVVGEPKNVVSLTVTALSPNEINMPTKVRSRRKINRQENNTKISADVANGVSDVTTLFQDRSSLTKKIHNCLSRKVRRWCAAEWFYSAIDYPWFAKREFAEYLDHVGLGHVSKLTRVEWGVIRSSLGRPRRFSQKFMNEEKEKLYQYRESVRKHYAELRSSARSGLPTDLARPLSVGQRVISVHPRTRDICNGSVLTVDYNRCHVQFDQPELGVEFVADVDCMPLNPVENMPASLVRHSLPPVKSLENGFNSHGLPIERNIEAPVLIPSIKLEDGLPPASVTNYHVDNLLQQAKEAVVSELKRMNDEVVESQTDGGTSIADSEPFQKHYASVVLQLSEVNEQLSSALLRLRERNTYQPNVMHMWFKPGDSTGEPLSLRNRHDHSVDGVYESGSQVAEIVESSRSKAQNMVAVAMQALSSVIASDSVPSLECLIDFVNNRLSVDDVTQPPLRSSPPPNSSHGTTVSQDQSSSCTEDMGTSTHEPDTKPKASSLQTDTKPNPSSEQTDTKPNPSSGQTDTKPNPSSEQTDTKPNPSSEQTDTKPNPSSDQTDTKPNPSSDQTDTKPNPSSDQTATKPNTPSEQTDTKPNASLEQTDTKPRASSEQTDPKPNASSDQTDAQIPSELIANCVATLQMIQRCTERQLPPSDVAQVLDTAVMNLKPSCPQNLPIYAEIQKYMSIIKNQILALVPK